MILPDVNVLVHAHRADALHHDRCVRWLDDAVNGPEQVGLADVVVTGFVRIVTNPRIYRVPAPIETALGAIDALLQHPGVARIVPGPRHWTVFSGVCRAVNARGNLVADAAIAAIAIEHGATVVTIDRDFARFPGLRWESPLGG